MPYLDIMILDYELVGGCRGRTLVKTKVQNMKNDKKWYAYLTPEEYDLQKSFEQIMILVNDGILQRSFAERLAGQIEDYGQQKYVEGAEDIEESFCE